MQEEKLKAMIWVESGGPVGHLQVAAITARALIKKNYDVTVVTGSAQSGAGANISFGGANVIHLPSVKLQGSALVNSKGIDIVRDKEWQNERAQKLQNIFCDLQPDVIVTETYPIVVNMGFIHELDCLRTAVKESEKPVAMYGIIREDSLYASSNSGIPANYAARIVNESFDGVFVRGQKDIMQEEPGEVLKRLSDKLQFVGYFVQDLPERDDTPNDEREVIVSSGGGVFSDNFGLHKAAILARKHTSLSDRVWRHVISPDFTNDELTELRALAQEHGGDRIIIDRGRGDLKELIAQSALSISKNGYNTTMEALASRVPSVIAGRWITQGETKGFKPLQSADWLNI